MFGFNEQAVAVKLRDFSRRILLGKENAFVPAANIRYSRMYIGTPVEEIPAAEIGYSAGEGNNVQFGEGEVYLWKEIKSDPENINGTMEKALDGNSQPIKRRILNPNAAAIPAGTEEKPNFIICLEDMLGTLYAAASEKDLTYLGMITNPSPPTAAETEYEGTGFQDAYNNDNGIEKMGVDSITRALHVENDENNAEIWSCDLDSYGHPTDNKVYNPFQYRIPALYLTEKGYRKTVFMGVEDREGNKYIANYTRSDTMLAVVKHSQQLNPSGASSAAPSYQSVDCRPIPYDNSAWQNIEQAQRDFSVIIPTTEILTLNAGDVLVCHFSPYNNAWFGTPIKSHFNYVYVPYSELPIQAGDVLRCKISASGVLSYNASGEYNRLMVVQKNFPPGYNTDGVYVPCLSLESNTGYPPRSSGLGNGYFVRCGVAPGSRTISDNPTSGIPGHEYIYQNGRFAYDPVYILKDVTFKTGAKVTLWGVDYTLYFKQTANENRFDPDCYNYDTIDALIDGSLYCPKVLNCPMDSKAGTIIYGYLPTSRGWEDCTAEIVGSTGICVLGDPENFAQVNSQWVQGQSMAGIHAANQIYFYRKTASPDMSGAAYY